MGLMPLLALIETKHNTISFSPTMHLLQVCFVLAIKYYERYFIHIKLFDQTCITCWKFHSIYWSFFNCTDFFFTKHPHNKLVQYLYTWTYILIFRWCNMLSRFVLARKFSLHREEVGPRHYKGVTAFMLGQIRQDRLGNIRSSTDSRSTIRYGTHVHGRWY